MWYPLVKKVGALVGKQVTKKTVEKTITKALPVVGGIVSGGLTYVTFRPMGNRLADTFVKNLNGDFDDQLALKAEFAATMLDTPTAGAAEEVSGTPVIHEID